jgi:hypothetical protein
MRSENVSTPSSPEIVLRALYHLPKPAPQAAAWRRALKVIGCIPPGRPGRISKTTVRRVTLG